MHVLPRLRAGAVMLAAVTAVFGTMVISPSPAAAARSPEQIARDCLNVTYRQAGDLVYEVPECRLTYKSSQQVLGEAEIPDAIGDSNKPRPVARSCGAAGGSVGVAGMKSSSTSFSFGLDIGGKKKFGDWEASVGPKLGWSWSWSTSDTYTNTANVPGWGVAWITVRRPLIKAVVDIAADYDDGNGMQYGKNLTVYVPDKSRSYDWALNSRPMSDWEISKYCGSGGGGDSGYTESTSFESSYGDFRLWLPSQYRLFNAHSGKCMVVKDDSRTAGARIVQRDCPTGTSSALRWTRVKQADGSFLQKNDASGKCADVTGDEMADWLSLDQQNCTPSAPQQNWAVMRVTVKIPPHYDAQPAFYLYNRKSGKCMALDHNNLLSNDAPLQQYDCGSLPKPKPTGAYDLWSVNTTAYKNVLSGKCLDRGSTISGGGMVVQRSCNGKSSQKWTAAPRNGGWFNIKNANGYCLTAPYNNGTPPGENTQLMWWGCETRWDSANQYWSVNPMPGGRYTFSNQWTKLCLAPHSSDVTKDGGRVALRRCVS
ncbi:RICIN domain-containing protein [Streptosporangium sp. NPDC020072]|uniref:RICIN domain-containing protein n=1 Tax=Streptosporangium sp. NPDC020072 TaxID=3154788 RepID=UPI00341EDDAA